MPYLTAVIKESQRIDSTAESSLVYQVEKEATVCGVTLQKGLLIAMAINALNFDVTAYNEPQKFKPERFMSDSDEFYIPGTK